MMTRGRIEAFTDGVLAIIITIMVLELKVPHGGGFADLIPLLPIFGSYLFRRYYSFVSKATRSLAFGICWCKKN